MTLKDLPADERPREKLLRHGVSTLSDAELVALFIQTGCRGHTAVDVARRVLSDFGGLTALLMADKKQFCRMRGLGTARYAILQAALELSRRHVFASVSAGDALASPDHVRQYLALHLTGLEHEVFAALFLDNRHRVIDYQELFHGTLDSAAVYPREVVKNCLARNAASVIFAHNHGLPGG